MRWPEAQPALIRSFASGKSRPVRQVRLLGHGPVQFEQTAEGLSVSLPPVAPTDGPHGLAIE